MNNPINEILPFAIDDGANVESQADYAADPTRGSGFQQGKASSSRFNKVWRQAAFVAAGVAQLVVNRLNESVLDNGDVTTFVQQLNSALQGGSGGGGGTVVGGATVNPNGIPVFSDSDSTSTILRFKSLVSSGSVAFTDLGDGTIKADAGIPTDYVNRVFGRAGPAITAQFGDYKFNQIDQIPYNLISLGNLILAANTALISNGSSSLNQVAMAANTFLARASTGDISAQAVTDFSIALLANADSPSWRNALGLGTAAVLASDNDPTLSADSSTRLPTQQAVVSYVTAAIAQVFKAIGNWDASGNVFPSTGGTGPGGTILDGNLWVIDAPGTLGTHAVVAGDMIVAVVDNPGQTQANWAFIEGGLGYVPQQQNAALTQISTAGSATANTFWARASTGALALKTITDFGLSFLTATSVSAAQIALSLVPGTNVQAQSAVLQDIVSAGQATANTFWARASTGSLALKVITDSALSLLASLTGFTGSGNTLVLSNSPVLVTPNLGTPSAAVLTNASGTANALTAGIGTNIGGGLVNQIPVQSGGNATTFIAAPTVSSTFLSWTGSAFAWVAGAVGASLTAANQFLNQNAVTPYRASITGAVSIDMSTVGKSNNLHLTLTGNVTSFAMTNILDGAVYNIRLIQDGTGGRTFAIPSVWKFAGGVQPTFITTPNAVNFVSLEYGSTENTYMAAGNAGMA